MDKLSPPTADHAHSCQVIFRIGVPLPLVPEKSANGTEYWDWQKLIALETELHVFLDRLGRFWFDLLREQRNLLELRWYQAVYPNGRKMMLELFSRHAIQQDAFKEPKRELLDETRDLCRLLSEYTYRRKETTSDIPLQVGDPKSEDPTSILSQNSITVRAAQDLLMQDARRESERPSLTLSLDERENIDVPAALGEYAYEETTGKLSVDGYFDDLSDTRGQGVIRHPDRNEVFSVKIPPKLRQGTAAAYFRRTLIRATLSKTVYSIAGSSKSRGYVLMDFRKVKEEFSETDEFHESGTTLDMFHQERRSGTSSKYQGLDQRKPADDS